MDTTNEGSVNWSRFTAFCIEAGLEASSKRKSESVFLQFTYRLV